MEKVIILIASVITIEVIRWIEFPTYFDFHELDLLAWLIMAWAMWVLWKHLERERKDYTQK